MENINGRVSGRNLDVDGKFLMRISKKNIVRLGAAGFSSISVAGAVWGATKKPLPATLAASAMASAQLTMVLGDVSIGRAVGSLSREIKNDRIAFPKAVESLSKKASVLTETAQKRILDSIKTVSPTATPKVVSAGLKDTEIPKSADPRNRRTGASISPHINEKAKSRMNSPITGAEKASWLDSRVNGLPYETSECSAAWRGTSLPFAREVPVAMIADEFTYHSFKWEFDAIRLTPENWREQFRKHNPQLFFCESAWQGGPPEKRPWQGKVYASVRWPKENRKTLLEILDYCHKENIPTVFWNKEDPTHFSDRINDFVRTAALFDYVLTTTEECVDAYRKDAGVLAVDVLPFAVQPRIFNPQAISRDRDQVTFAGTWYGNYPERCAAAEQIMDQSVDAGYELVIYDRMYGSPQARHQYPERFQAFTNPAIDYEETADKFKSSKFGITLNTVTESSTMFARRVFELAACGAVVLSNFSKGVEAFFGDSVIFADREPTRLENLTSAEYQEIQRRAMKIALENTYLFRAEQILEFVGMPFQRAFQNPAGVVQIQTLDQYREEVDEFRQAAHIDQLIVVVDDEKADQSLVFTLMMLKDEGVTVISERAVKNREVRSRSFIDRPFVVTKTQEGIWPNAEQVWELMLHTQHFDGALAYSDSLEERYSLKHDTAYHGRLFPARWFYNALASDSAVPTFFI